VFYLRPYIRKYADDRDKHIAKLHLECDAVIVVYDDTQAFCWARDQLLYCRKMQSSREQPFKTIAVYDKPFPDKPDLRIYLPSLRVLECPTPQAEPVCQNL